MYPWNPLRTQQKQLPNGGLSSHHLISIVLSYSTSCLCHNEPVRISISISIQCYSAFINHLNLIASQSPNRRTQPLSIRSSETIRTVYNPQTAHNHPLSAPALAISPANTPKSLPSTNPATSSPPNPLSNPLNHALASPTSTSVLCP